MLKSLKRKCIFISMLLIGVVLFSIFTSICIITYRSEESEIKTELKRSILLSQKSDLFDPINDKMIPSSYVFTANVKSNGTVIVFNSEIDEKTVKSAVREAMSSEASNGIIKNLHLSFLKDTSNGETLIAFVSRDGLYNRVNATIIMSITAFAVCMLLFYYISKHLVELALEPVYKVWNQQKQFIADASHDLKTPLTVILANNNILASHKEESVDSQMQWIESTGEEATRMSELVNKMLELAKSEDGLNPPSLEIINISEICEETLLQFEVVAFEKNVSVESKIEPNIQCKTNSDVLIKILQILFDNAVKYSPDGDQITVSLSGTRFSINNKGEPISEEDLPHIFERFYRASKAREVGGYGLGLSIAQNLAQSINAKIDVESNEQDGTTFSIIFKK